MPKMTNVQGIRIQEQIEQQIGAAAAEEFAVTLPLSSSADYKRKFQWAKEVCNYLESKYTPEQIEKLRMSCHCTVNTSVRETLHRLYRTTNNLDEFCEAFGKNNNNAFSIWHEDQALFMSYPTCYCSCVKRVNETLSPTWCQCTVGYTKSMFDYVLERDTKVELLESIKMGDSRCVIKIS